MDDKRPLDNLVVFDNKKVEIQMKNGTTIIGVLKAFDYNLNLLLEETEEISTDKTVKLGSILLRGNNLVNIYESKE
ncbi:MAG: hypothetical protein K0B02_03265 [DPANN group archaeon]|nr:hypothetical protein [DPANN group archaeon]